MSQKIICTPAVLVRALKQYTKYLPTASEHLRECRQTWIPVHVRKAADKKLVRQIAEDILQGRAAWWVDNLQNPGCHPLSQYEGLRPEHRLAVALVLMQGYGEELARLHQGGATSDPIYTERVFRFLQCIPLDHATMAVRNCGPREGGPFSMTIISGMHLTKVPGFMTVIMAIRAKWDARGFDWNRRKTEESLLTHWRSILVTS